MKTIKELMSLEGKKAIVTGGAGHIGLAICESLMELGAAVSILDNDEKGCNDQCVELNSKNYKNKVNSFIVDLSDEVQIKKTVESTVQFLGGLDIIIHAAAFVGSTKFPGWAVIFDKQTVKAWNIAMAINLTSAFIIVQSALPYLKKSRHASIVFIGSIYGLIAPDFNLYTNTDMQSPAAYGVSKAGLIQLCKYFSALLAPDIRCNIITAGGVWRKQPQSFVKKYLDKTPLKRMANEEDFKGAIAFLSSSLSSYVTGTNIIVDGGFTAW